MDARDWGLLVFLSVLWGGSFLFIGIAVKELPPLVIVLARVAIASAVLLPIHLLRLGPLPRDSRSWITFAGMSLLNNVIPFTLIVTGQTMIASGLASVINATTPFFAAVLLAVSGEERLIPRKADWPCCRNCRRRHTAWRRHRYAGRPDPGHYSLPGAAASYGLSGLWAKWRLKGIAPLTSATGQLIVLDNRHGRARLRGSIARRPFLSASGPPWAAILAWRFWRRRSPISSSSASSPTSGASQRASGDHAGSGLRDPLRPLRLG